MENKPSGGDNFVVDELLNFTDVDDGDDTLVVDPADSSASSIEVPFLDDYSCRSIVETKPSSDDLCVPYEDVAELEWLSNFVEDSFSSQDIQNMSLITGTKPPSDAGSETRSPNTESDLNITQFQPEIPVPGKARTKRPRAAPCDWASRLSILSPGTSPPSTPTSDQKKKQKKRKVLSGATSESGAGAGGTDSTGAPEGDGRRCLHCATDKTPQWRTGPMGPKTLCNACGVRYKSGRLVPEYRPAASPTFVVQKHSNSHRKVMELRRQKEAQKRVYHQMFDMGGGMVVFDGSEGDDYLIHQYTGPDFRNLI